MLDISGNTPVINLTNQSYGNQEESPVPDLSDLVWVLNIYSPTGTPIYTSDFNNPFKTGEWDTAAIENAWPKPFGQIEWSGADYRIEFQVKDADGTIWELNKSATVCRPYGNNKKSTDTFGHVKLDVTVECGIGQLYIADATSKTYQGIAGSSLSSYMAVDYPRDPTGTLPEPFEITSFSNDALVPFTYNAKGYKASYYTVWQYGLGDNVFLNIRYAAQTLFNVECNIDLCPLACEIDELINKINTGRCADVDEAKEKLFMINAKFNLAVIAKFNPTCGMDLPALIDEIKEIGGFSCDCTNGNSGIGSTSSAVAGLLFDIESEGGDVSGRMEQTGNNITFYIKDKHYTFDICPDSQTTAFQFRSAVNGTTISTCLYVRKSQLSYELLNVIKNDAELTNLFNSIVINSDQLVSVDGKCILAGSNVTDYSWALTDIPASPNNARAVSIKNGNNVITKNFVFNRSTYAALQAKLNTLNLGTFLVTDNGGGSITITSTNNSFTLSNFTYNVGSGNRVANMTAESAGVQEYTTSEVLQAIIDYLSPIDETKISLSQDYEVPTIVDGVGATVLVEASEDVCDPESTLKTLLEAFIDAQTDIVNFVLGINGADCAALKSLFADNTKVVDANSRLFGIKEGVCSGMDLLQAFQFMLAAGKQDATTKGLFCDFVGICGAGLSCEAISFNLVVNASDSACSNIVGIQGEWV